MIEQVGCVFDKTLFAEPSWNLNIALIFALFISQQKKD